VDNIILKHPIRHDTYTEAVSKFYDLAKQDESVTTIKNNIQLPTSAWNVGVIYGSSGTGKTTLLKTFGKIIKPSWNNEAIVSNFSPIAPQEVFALLSAVGLSTVPAWLRPYTYLSNGEQFRADLARVVMQNNDPILIDEFTSVVDRNVAKSASYALAKYIRKQNKKVIVASCHNDILEWLEPDWIYNPVSGETYYPRGSLCRPKLDLEIFRCKYAAWEYFKSHHYLSETLNKAARCFMCTWNDVPVGFIAILALPHPKLKNAWRATRMVVLPDYQGLGFGGKLADYMGSLIKARNGLFYRRIAHPAVISYNRKHNDLWAEIGAKSTKFSETSKLLSGSNQNGAWLQKLNRDTVGFKYIGPAASFEESRLFYEG